MEIRGVWLTTTASSVLNSQQNIAQAMKFLADTGFNVVFPVVWNSAATIYPSRVMRENFGVEIDSRFKGRDPLAELIVEAKRVGLAVIPWFEYGFASSYNLNGGLLLSKKPEWAARDRTGTLVKKNGFEWMNALDPEVQQFLLNLILEVVNNYEIAGIQGDDRLPALPSEGGYDAKTVERYRQEFNSPPPQNPKDPQWLQWRADILTDFLTRLYQSVISIKPNLLVSMAPSPYIWSLQEYLQDSQAWVDRGLIDMIHPQLYSRDVESYKRFVDKLVVEQFTAQQLPTLTPGILMKSGTYRMSPDYLLQAIAYNRSRGIQGEVFFFYEGLREDNDALAKVLRSGAYSQPAAPFNPLNFKQRSFTHRRIGSQYRYIDKTGQLISQPRFDWVYPFVEGLAPVKMGYKWSYIDKSGKLISRWQFDSAEPFSEGLALVRIRNQYGYIDKAGKLVIPVQFEAAGSFSAGLAKVKVGNQWGYIDQLGKVVISPQFDAADAFSQGLAWVKLANKYGYINTTGQWVIQPQFEAADAFSEGLARVQVGNQWGYIDPTGKVVIPVQFALAKSFSEKLAAVQIGDKWGYIDQTGKLVIPLEFDSAEPFAEGMALVNIGGEWLKSSETGDWYFGGGKWGYIRNLVSQS